MVHKTIYLMGRSFLNPPRKVWKVPRSKKIVPPEFYEEKRKALEEEVKYVIGQVLGTEENHVLKGLGAEREDDRVRVRYRKYLLDPILLAYFPYSREVEALGTRAPGPGGASYEIGKGDIVLLEKLGSYEEQPSRECTHRVAEVVFSAGRVFDPLTGRRVLTLRRTDVLFSDHARRIAEVDAPNLRHSVFQPDFAHHASDLLEGAAAELPDPEDDSVK